MLLNLFLLTIYLSLSFYLSRRLFDELDLECRSNYAQMSGQYERLVKRKEALYQEKMQLESEAIEIFTLYEITKEITKSLSAEDAFNIFRNKLSQHVHFVDCRLLPSLVAESEDARKQEGHFLFMLKGKRQKIGYLDFVGIREKDKEKIRIMGNQFALAFRRVKLYEEIERIAITDSLTEVYTRRYALERLREEIKRSRVRKISLSFLMIDVDHFKSINDHHGHLAGDQVLRELGGIIKENIREIDIAGRYGGEEFCVILPDTEITGAQYAAERIRKSTQSTLLRVYDTKIKTTVSIGIATYPTDGAFKQELIDKADWALYRAKKLGRNRVCAFGVYDDAAE
ncbi:MAG: GGDEF domain-containing protein [Candidatus Omnitrophica bacterium]|nr:GGDEF domain-containing protein [Candidatus Omnitrophota bacterium]